MDEIQITVYTGEGNFAIHDDLLGMLVKVPENLYQIKQLPTDKTEQHALLTEMRKMRTTLSKYQVQDKWNASNLLKTPILIINDNTYPWWYIKQDPHEVWKQLKEIRDKYLETLKSRNTPETEQEKYDETKGILTTEETDTWIKTTSRKVKKLIKTPNRLYAEINSWDEKTRAGFMVGWNATNHDTIPDKLRKIAYELERNDVQHDRDTSMDSVGPTK